MQLKEYAVPTYYAPLMVADDDEVLLPDPSVVARRALILAAVVEHSENILEAESLSFLYERGIWADVSAREKEFLEDPSPSKQVAQTMEWRLESLWVLMWALKRIETLPWPSKCCDVKKLMNCVRSARKDDSFLIDSEIRQPADILDAAQLAMLQHWAITNSLLHFGGSIPSNFNWVRCSDWIPVPISQLANVILERHHALNWLASSGPLQDWDNVDVST